jgi:hypothetical protein
MRQLGWLHATPKDQKKSRLAAAKDRDPEFQPDFPELNGAEYLIGLLHEAGLMSNNGMGPISLSWLEIKAWIDTTEIQLSLWERLTLKEMSEVYVSERIQAEDANRTAPYIPNKEEELVEDNSKKFLTLLRKFKKPQPGEENEITE